MLEVWKAIPGYEFYEASDLGRVRSLDRLTGSRAGSRRLVRGRVLKPDDSNKNGYLYVRLYAESGHRNREVHQVILEAFVGPCPEGLETCHNDNDKHNNRLSNLRYDTHSVNIRERRPFDQNAVRGEQQHLSKLTDEKVREIRNRYRDGTTQTELAGIFGVTQANVSDVVRKRTWKHVA